MTREFISTKRVRRTPIRWEIASIGNAFDAEFLLIGKQELLMDPAKIRRRIVGNTLKHPVVLAPLAAGVTGMLGVAAVAHNPALAIGTGLLGGFGAVGAYLARAKYQGESIAEKALEELTREAHIQRQNTLNELDRALVTEDQDPRPEEALRDLRALLVAFERIDDKVIGPNVLAAVEIRMLVDQMFDHCVITLNQTRHFWKTAKNLVTPAAKQPLILQREKLIEDLHITLKQLSDTLVALQTMDGSRGSSAQLAKMRDQLNESLAAARMVEDKVEALIHDRGYDPAEFLPHAGDRRKE